MFNRLARYFAPSLIAAAIGAFVSAPLQQAQSADQPAIPALGVAMMEQGTACLSVDRAKLSVGEPVSLVVLQTTQTIVSATVAGPAPRCRQEAGYTTYALRSTGDLPDSLVAVGVLAPTSRLKMQAGSVSFFPANQQPLRFRSCTSADGFHVTAWHGAPLSGTLVWHRYVYLDQDLEQTCSDKETQDVGGQNG